MNNAAFSNNLTLMKNNFLLLTWLLALPLLWGGCDKQNNCPELKLPPLTTEGLNTFGCKIDGEIWVPHTDWQLIQTPLDFGEITVEHFDDENRFYIRVDRRPNGQCDSTNQVIHLSVSIDTLEQGVINYSTGFSDWNSGKWQYRLDTTSIANIEVHRFSLPERILSCSFSFNFLHGSSGEVKKVTDGRFDLSF